MHSLLVCLLFEYLREVAPSKFSMYGKPDMAALGIKQIIILNHILFVGQEIIGFSSRADEKQLALTARTLVLRKKERKQLE